VFTVTYEHLLAYVHDRDGKRFPRLTFRLSSAADPTRAMDVEAYLDSGAEKSLFDGRIAAILGIDVLAGPRIRYESAAGSSFAATIHPVRLVHDDLGSYELDVGFTSAEIKRNLLGRDFFNINQIGFRENQLSFFITSRP